MDVCMSSCVYMYLHVVAFRGQKSVLVPLQLGNPLS